jgi:hypothetical protein
VERAVALPHKSVNSVEWSEDLRNSFGSFGDVRRYSPCLFVRARSLSPTFVKHLSPVFTASGP